MEFEGGGMTDDTLMTTGPGRETADVYHLRRWLREMEDENKRLRSALKVIHTWASVDGALDPEDTRNLCRRTLGNE